MGFPLLSILLFLPIVGGIVILAVGRQSPIARQLAVAVSGVEVVLSIVTYFAYQSSSGSPEFQFVEDVPWISGLGVSYHLGVDGLSLVLTILTAVVTLLVILFATPELDERQHIYLFWMLFLETTVVGVFIALDLILFYVFFEAMLIPMYFLIGGWGSSRGRYAALKFFLYTLFGSLLMLVAIIGVRVLSSGSGTFDFVQLEKAPVSGGAQTWFFLAFALAFAIKAPIVPFSSWLPDAYVEGPTGASVMLAGVMSKVGAYGFLRFCLGLFPQASRQFAPLLATLCVVTILYGAWSAISQKDLKGLISYSSLGHMGLIVLGIFSLRAAGIDGSVFLMVAHGISITALFLLIGAIEARWKTRQIAELGGMQAVAPALAATLLIAGLSAMPLPGLNGFPGEFLILRGAFEGLGSYAYGVLATLGVILSASYLIWMYARVAYQEPSAALATGGAVKKDLRGRDWTVFAPLIALIIALGFVPGIVLSKTGPSALGVAASVQGAAASSQVNADGLWAESISVAAR
ncbi:MAG: NADH-quinone oxidoreductase subunit M [Chloroflexi bacterium]|nr:NADH-quinone oxidoreductase subunit M [Chloroflexota bacterium]